jgi:hypothetical protein
MRVGLLGTGFAVAHAGIYAARPDVEEVVVFGRTPEKLRTFADQFGFATTTDIDEIYEDRAIDLVDVCLPTPIQADHVIRALEAGKDVLCELPLASTMADAGRIVAAQEATGRESSSTCSPGSTRACSCSRARLPIVDTARRRRCAGRPAPAAVGGLRPRSGLDRDRHDALESGHDRGGRRPAADDHGRRNQQGHRRIRRRGAARLLRKPSPTAAPDRSCHAYEVQGNWRAVFTGGVLESRRDCRLRRASPNRADRVNRPRQARHRACRQRRLRDGHRPCHRLPRGPTPRRDSRPPASWTPSNSRSTSTTRSRRSSQPKLARSVEGSAKASTSRAPDRTARAVLGD